MQRSQPTQTEGRAKQRAYAIAALPEGDDLSELSELLRTAGVAVVGELVQHREQPHPNHYLGSGKLEELKPLLKEADANLVVADDELTPRQQRNIEAALGPRGGWLVWDSNPGNAGTHPIRIAALPGPPRR